MVHTRLHVHGTCVAECSR